MMVSCHHRQLFGRIFDALPSSILVFLFGARSVFSPRPERRTGVARSRGQAWPHRGHRRSRLVLDWGEHGARLVQVGIAVVQAGSLSDAGVTAPRLRKLGPFSSRRWARWTTRSRIASPIVGSAITSCQRLTGTWLVMSSEPFS